MARIFVSRNADENADSNRINKVYLTLRPIYVIIFCIAYKSVYHVQYVYIVHECIQTGINSIVYTREKKKESAHHSLTLSHLSFHIWVWLIFYSSSNEIGPAVSTDWSDRLMWEHSLYGHDCAVFTSFHVCEVGCFQQTATTTTTFQHITHILHFAFHSLNLF